MKCREAQRNTDAGNTRKPGNALRLGRGDTRLSFYRNRNYSPACPARSPHPIYLAPRLYATAKMNSPKPKQTKPPSRHPPRNEPRQTDRNAGEPLLLIPGMMCDDRLWQPQKEFLSAANADIRIADITAERDMQTLAAKILDDLSSETWKTFSVAGLSMGGIVAMELLKQAPHRIKRCALLDTNHLAERSIRKKLRAEEIRLAQTPAGLKKILIEKMKPAYLSPKRKYGQDFLDLVLDMALSLGPEVFARQSLALRDRPDYGETIKSIRCPVLLLCGEWDILCPPLNHQKMRQLLPQETPATLRLISKSGPSDHPGSADRNQFGTQRMAGNPRPSGRTASHFFFFKKGKFIKIGCL